MYYRHMILNHTYILLIYHKAHIKKFVVIFIYNKNKIINDFFLKN